MDFFNLSLAVDVKDCHIVFSVPLDDRHPRPERRPEDRGGDLAEAAAMRANFDKETPFSPQISEDRQRHRAERAQHDAAYLYLAVRFDRPEPWRTEDVTFVTAPWTGYGNEAGSTTFQAVWNRDAPNASEPSR